MKRETIGAGLGGGEEEFVVEDGEAVNGGGFCPENQFPEGNRKDTSREDSVHFSGREIAFGADPDGGGGRKAAML